MFKSIIAKKIINKKRIIPPTCGMGFFSNFLIESGLLKTFNLSPITSDLINKKQM
jgi:hypothetical protein